MLDEAHYAAEYVIQPKPILHPLHQARINREPTQIYDWFDPGFLFYFFFNFPTPTEVVMKCLERSSPDSMRNDHGSSADRFLSHLSGKTPLGKERVYIKNFIWFAVQGWQFKKLIEAERLANRDHPFLIRTLDPILTDLLPPKPVSIRFLYPLTGCIFTPDPDKFVRRLFAPRSEQFKKDLY